MENQRTTTTTTTTTTSQPPASQRPAQSTRGSIAEAAALAPVALNPTARSDLSSVIQIQRETAIAPPQPAQSALHPSHATAAHPIAQAVTIERSGAVSADEGGAHESQIRSTPVAGRVLAPNRLLHQDRALGAAPAPLLPSQALASSGEAHQSRAAQPGAWCAHVPQTTVSTLRAATSNFAPSTVLGRGAFGTVHSGVLHGTRVAIKRLDSRMAHRTALDLASTEIQALSRYRHPAVVALLAYAVDENDVLLVLDYAAHGTLRLCLDVRPADLDWARRLSISLDIASALVFLQRLVPHMPLMHLDVKSDNVLLDAAHSAKLADFGLSRTIPMRDARLGDNEHCIVRAGKTLGTQYYLCPQLAATGHLSRKTDVHGFGMVLAELCTGEHARVLGSRLQSASSRWEPDRHLTRSPAALNSVNLVWTLAQKCTLPVAAARPSFDACFRQLQDASATSDEHSNSSANHRQCTVCRDAEPTAMLLPCRHACVCETCALSLLERTQAAACPICRQRIQQFELGEFLQTFV
ncbi:serine/threonine-protein kinase PBS1 [Capsaspora owczarzaki ATCC 30864]|uniref:TKL/IRAK protein kinase n=1 Tax=Capsaspora owczarzaki (strain ATCC 30864) TaxID=595528 RepID=A0A0D2VX73_CAPO3|nr:serine/threonine-protein kinase PBS1 [Capsaspora owczarzaki ATCC 30864]KJE96212.1 TKL/IRAK protein kinase [Capsaspora owczarzaki ATCC 30864]|eukprot:XP_004345316.1 serine/threonine-protein kinase PBS1 [Capsaspora owczarzaki ATCC 30864]